MQREELKQLEDFQRLRVIQKRTKTRLRAKERYHIIEKFTAAKKPITGRNNLSVLNRTGREKNRTVEKLRREKNHPERNKVLGKNSVGIAQLRCPYCPSELFLTKAAHMQHIVTNHI